MPNCWAAFNFLYLRLGENQAWLGSERGTDYPLEGWPCECQGQSLKLRCDMSSQANEQRGEHWEMPLCSTHSWSIFLEHLVTVY